MDMLTLATGQGRIRSFYKIAALALVAVVLFAAPLVLSEFRLSLLAKFLTFVIVAMALDLVWGYAGMLSLGHGVFFGLGGYAMAMYLKQEASAGALPDFMSWSGLEKLPLFWMPFASPWFAVPMTFVLPAIVGGAIGYLVFRSRITGVYFSLITQALALIMSILFIGEQAYTGGTNGLTNYSTMFGYLLLLDETKWALYYATVIAVGLVYVLCRSITLSRFGRLLVALRDDENRVRFFGYDPALVKTVIFALSAGLSGIAGALYAPQVGIVSPAMMGIVPSIEMVIWVAVGGRGTLYGAALGAVLVNSAKSGLSESFPNVWQYFLGAMFIGAVLLFPSGIVGFFQDLPANLRRLSRAGELTWPVRRPKAEARLEATGASTPRRLQ